jgi:hypothetical protein
MRSASMYLAAFAMFVIVGCGGSSQQTVKVGEKKVTLDKKYTKPAEKPRVVYQSDLEEVAAQEAEQGVTVEDAIKDAKQKAAAMSIRTAVKYYGAGDFVISVTNHSNQDVKAHVVLIPSADASLSSKAIQTDGQIQCPEGQKSCYVTLENLGGGATSTLKVAYGFRNPCIQVLSQVYGQPGMQLKDTCPQG